MANILLLFIEEVSSWLSVYRGPQLEDSETSKVDSETLQQVYSTNSNSEC